MNKYANYCTEEQVRKALELGASIEYAKVIDTCEGRSIRIPDEYGEFYALSTIEQMIGWIDDKGLLVVISKNYNDYRWEIWKGSLIVDMSELETLSSRKEAALAAIDAALEYLENLKK